MADSQNQLMVRPESAVGYVPQSLGDLMQVGKLLVQSGLAPESVKTAEQAAIIMLKGMELGLKPLESFADVYVVRGQASLGTKLMVALFKRAGHKFEIDEWTKERVSGRLILRDGSIHEHELTRKECDEAKWSQDYEKESRTWKEKHTWAGMGKTMLMYRWQSTAIRAYCPEVLHGMVTPDEALDEVTPREADVDDMTIDARVTVLATGPEETSGTPQGATEPDPEPEAAAATQPAVVIPDERPYPPEALKAVLAQKTKQFTQERGDKASTKSLQGSVAGALTILIRAAYHLTDDDEELITGLRHKVTDFLLGKESTTELTDVEGRVLLGWSSDKIIEEGKTVYAPHPMAVQEVMAVLSHIENVEQELLF